MTQSNMARKEWWAIGVVVCTIWWTVFPNRSAEAQNLTAPIPVNEEAASIFMQGVQAFEAGDYGMAYRRFRLVTGSYEFNRSTTAALAMAAKALYRDGRFEEAARLAGDFIRSYPTSSYREEIERVWTFAAQEMEAQANRRALMQIGIALPLTGSADVAQSVFNGIRIAVDAHNRVSGDELPVRMVFRDTHGDPSTAREIIAGFDRDEIDVVIGPVFSDEARAAASEAERRGLVMMAPLATDADVADGRRYVFQANPPIVVRGRVMASHALRYDDGPYGIIARIGDSLGERMAEGFQDEVMMQGGTVEFYQLLDSNADWARITSVVGRDTLERAPALYLALAGTGSRAGADAALRGLADEGVATTIYGADGWQDVSDRQLASHFNTTFATDYHVETSSSGVRDFERAYREIAGSAPDRPAFTGYDVTTFVLTRRLANPEAALERILHNDAVYQGLGIRLDFGRSNVNEALYIFGYRNGRLELLR